MYLMDATYENVRDVMHDMSDISLAEMGAAGATNAWQGLIRAKLCKDKGFLKAIMLGPTPVAIFGAAKVDVNTMRTWFIGSDKYFSLKIAGVKVAAREMARMAEAYPHFSFESVSASTEPSVIKWFSALGFNRVKTEGCWTTFRYVGRKLKNAKNHDMIEPTRA